MAEIIMKILFVFTGGTIGSTATDGYISPDGKKPYLLLESYDKKYGIDFQFDITQPYTELSENNTGETVSRLITALSVYENSGYDGIIVTHGTDTIQYSAAALGYTLKPKMPVVIVSSNFPIDDPMANGIANLHGALKFISETKRAGVWVSYTNSGENTVIHYGTRLLAHSAFSDGLYSAKGAYYGSFDGNFNFVLNENNREFPDETAPLPCGDLESAAKRILRIEPYVGMVYPQIENVDYIIHGSFHSGTINTKSRICRKFFESAAKGGKTVFLTGAVSGEVYESTRLFPELSVVPVENIAPIAAYVKLWLCAAAGIDPKEVLEKSLGADKI